MNSSEQNTTVPRNRATALVESLADFLRVSALYPANNARVQNSGQAVLESSASFRGGSLETRIRLTRDGFAVDDEPVDSTRSNVAWLADSMRAIATSGIVLKPSATIDSLLAFAEQLRRNLAATQRVTTFQALWPEPIDGVEPVEHVLSLSTTGWNNLPEEVRALLGDNSAQGARLREMLDAGGDVVERLAGAIATRVTTDAQNTVTVIELLRRMLDVLPAEIVADPKACLEMVRKAVQVSADSVREIAQMPEDRAATEFRRMALDVSTRFFVRPDGRTDPEPDPTPPRAAPRGHPGDDKVTDDLAAFITEVGALPDEPQPCLDPANADAPTEKLGICLHRLLHARDDNEARGLEASLLPLLADDGALHGDVVHQYLLRLCEPRTGPRPWTRFAALAGSLERTRLLAVAIERGGVPHAALAAAFPAGFGAYVDSIATHATESLGSLAELLGAVSVERVLAQRSALLEGQHVLTRARMAKILGTRVRGALPFLHLALVGGIIDDRAQVADYLLRIASTKPECAALVVDPAWLPRKYLTALSEFLVRNGKEAPTLARESEALLRTFLERGGDEDIERQVRAIEGLGSFWSPRTEEFLRGLLAGSGLLKLKKRPKAIRAAIKNMLSSRPERAS